MSRAHIAVYGGDSIAEFRDIETPLIPFAGYESALRWLRKVSAVAPVTVLINVREQIINIVVSRIPEQPD